MTDRIAVKRPKHKTADELADLCRQGYTLRLGTTTTSGHVYPAWEWQLFNPAGEFVEAVQGKHIAAVRAAGLGPMIHGSMSRLRGIGR